MTSTHAISSDLMDRIIHCLDSSDMPERDSLINELNKEREWFVISVLHRARLVEDIIENDDFPMRNMTDDVMAEIANDISNNQQYDDELYDAIFVAVDKHFKKIFKKTNGGDS